MDWLGELVVLEVTLLLSLLTHGGFCIFLFCAEVCGYLESEYFRLLVWRSLLAIQ